MGKVRQPIHQKSIATKEKIIKYGFQLMCEKGYHNVNTIDIANASHVSTGIIYQYFHDKHDILIEGVKRYSDEIMFPMMDVLKNEADLKNNFETALEKMIQKTKEAHTISEKAYRQLQALQNSDEEVFQIFKQKEMETTEEIEEILQHQGFQIQNQRERVHFLIHMIDVLCQELSYHQHQNFNYQQMTKETIRMIMCLFYDCTTCKKLRIES